MTELIRVSSMGGVPPGADRPKMQVIPVRGLPIVALAMIFIVVAITGNWEWALVFCHVVGGAMWTGIDLFVGLVLGPILGRLSIASRAEFSAKFMPMMAIIMPTVVTMTLASGFQIDRKPGDLNASSPNHAWLIVSFCVVGVLAVVALGILEPANIAAIFEGAEQASAERRDDCSFDAPLHLHRGRHGRDADYDVRDHDESGDAMSEQTLSTAPTQTYRPGFPPLAG